jgi:amino acid transporter
MAPAGPAGEPPGGDGTRSVAPGLLRGFSFRTAFSLAFAFISPIVALYTIFAMGLATSGPGFWLGFPAAMAGQLLVALVFSMLASRWPLEGSVYQWSRMLVGRRYGWFAGWTYIWTLLITMAAVSLGGASFLAQLLGLDPGNRTVSTSLALALLAFATWGNTRGRRVLGAMVWLCVMAEMIGSVGVGSWLLWTGRLHSPAVIFSGGDLLSGGSGWLGFLDTKLAAAIAICGWAFVGFESAGAIAEEVSEPARNVPRAMIGSLIFVATIVSFSGLALLLAVPNLEEAVAGRSADPVVDTLLYHFGPTLYRFFLVLFVIGFLACLLGVQTSVSRVLWAFARDGELPASRLLGRLSGRDQLPAHAIAVSGALAAMIFALSFTNLYAILVNFTTAGFYIAFGFPVLAAAWTVVRGSWEPSPFHLGVFGKPVIFLAAGWTVFEAVNIAWPRTAGVPWYEAGAVVLMVLFLGTLGVALRAALDRGREAVRK